jgi:ribosomal protein L7/L12
MLEALKLYLNLPNCVYFLAVDRTALENSIRQRYKKLEMREADYLDKIVQLPFVIPPIPSESIDEFVASLLPRALLPAKEILTTGLGDNPRQVKRFINMLVLNHHMAAESRIWCDPCVLALVLLLQHRQPGLFKLIASEPALLSKLHDKTKLSKEVFETYLATDERLRRVVEANPVPEYVPVASYIYLTKFARVGEGVFDIVLTSVGPNKINAIKIIRQVTGADLREAKEMVDNTPSTILSGVSQRTAEAIKARFEDTQLVVEIR